MSIEIKDNEIFKDGEKVGYLTDPENHLRMTRGNAGFREEIEAYLSARPSKQLSDDPNGAQGEPATGFLPQPGNADFAPHETKDDGNPPVPERAPQKSGGRGIYDPPYFWWAWNQPTLKFREIYGKTQEQFLASENGGYVEKVRKILTQD